MSDCGFGYIEGDNRIFRWVEGGDMEVCSLKPDEIRTMVDNGLTDGDIVRILESCD